MMTTHTTLTPPPPVNPVNGIKPLIRWELVALIVQFFVLAAGLIFNYASVTIRLNSVEDKLNQHIAQHSIYLRTDVWEVRNRFIDEKLDRIEKKVDMLIEKQKLDNDRQLRR